MARFPGDWLVVPSGLPKVRNNDVDHPFRPGSDFVWLTGCQEPGGVVVLGPEGNGSQATLYLRPRSDHSTSAFFTDARNGALWVGRGPGLEDVAVLLAMPTAPLDALGAGLKEVPPGRIRVLVGLDPSAEAVVAEMRPQLDTTPDLDRELAEASATLRLIKDDFEIASIQAAVDATARGFDELVEELPGALATSERWLEGTFRRRARVEGNDVAYGVIAAAGAHACTLHRVENDGPVREGDLVLVDAGVESLDLYAADITRTIPVSGRFTPTQREVYEVVWRAHQAALAECRPGNPFMAPHRAAVAVTARWLVDKGLLPLSDEDPLHQQDMLHRRFTLHGTSHMLGLDVHDCASARSEYVEMDLEAGMVLTVEPGCYFQPDDATVPPEYRGIGVRIEDDVLITSDGHRVLSAALPTEAGDVEAWVASRAWTHHRVI